MALREEAMHRNVIALLAEAGTAAKNIHKTVLMSHNLHLAKDFDRIRGNFGAGPGGGRVPALGTYVNRMFPEKSFQFGCSAIAVAIASRFRSAHPRSTRSRVR